MLYDELDPDRHELAKNVVTRGYKRALRPANIAEDKFIDRRRCEASCFDPVEFLYLGEPREVLKSTGKTEVQRHFVFFGVFCSDAPGPVNGLI
jgi:hypothetical protein